MTVLEAARALGETLSVDPVLLRYHAAKEAFEQDAALSEKTAEYNAQRALLGREFAKDTAMQDGELIDTLQKRVEELAAQINTSPVRQAYEAATEQVRNLMKQVNGEITFYAFGERPCNHDCSSCSGCKH